MVTESGAHGRRLTLTPPQIDLIRRTQLPAGATEDDLRLLIYVAERSGLDPLLRQIYLHQRDGRFTPQATIDGFRVAAERTGLYRGQTVPLFCGEDGQWTDAWTQKTPPVLAKVGILRAGFAEPVYGVARYEAYVQLTRDGKVVRNWARMPDHMLAKVAEALAFRKAFPDFFAGLYTAEELTKAEEPTEPAPRRARAAAPADPPAAPPPDDAEEPGAEAPPADPAPTDPPMTDAQARALWAAARAVGYDVADLLRYANDLLGTAHPQIRALSQAEAERVLAAFADALPTASV